MASDASVVGARGVGGGCGVCGASSARGVGRLGHRAQGCAFGFVLPCVGACVDAFCGAVASRVVCVFAGVVCGGSFEQVHRGYAAGDTFDLALVATGPSDLGRSVASRAVWCSRAGHHGRRLVVLSV